MALADMDESSGPRLEFSQVFESHVSFVWRVLEHHGIRGDDVEDAAQEVFIIVAKKLATVNDPSCLRSWLFGIARRVAASHRRRAHVRREQLASDPGKDRAEMGQHARNEQVEALTRLESVLGELKEEQRMAFILREVEQLSIQEVAQALGCPLQTAYSRVKAAREHVIAAFREPNPQEVVDAG